MAMLSFNTCGKFRVVNVSNNDIDVTDLYQNKMYVKNIRGFEEWFEYDKNGNIIHYKDSNGYEDWQEYDKDNNLIHFRTSDGYEQWYNSGGDRITEKEFYSVHLK